MTVLIATYIILESSREYWFDFFSDCISKEIWASKQLEVLKTLMQKKIYVPL